MDSPVKEYLSNTSIERNKIEDTNILILDNMSMTQFSSNLQNLNSIQYLSLQNNLIKRIDFLKLFPNLWYLDIRENQLENFEGIIYQNCLGFLGISLGKYNFSKFMQLKNINIGILIIDGLIGDADKYCNFVFNSNNKIFKVNEDIIFYNHEKNISYLLNDNLDHPTENINEKQKIQDQKGTDNGKKVELASFMKIFSKGIEQIIAPIFRLIEPKSFNTRSETISDMGTAFKNLKGNLTSNKNLEKVYVKRHSIKYNRRHSQFLNLELENMKEYLTLEKKKLIIVFNLYCSITEFERIKSKVKFDFSLLKVNDSFTQIIILVVLMLYILSILNKLSALFILKFILKHSISKSYKNLSKCLKNILEIESVYLLGYYYSLHDYLLNTFKIKAEQETIIDNLELLNLIIHANKLKNNNKECTKMYFNSSFDQRKSIINSYFIKFIHKDLKVFNNVTKICQYLYDYLIITKLDQNLLNSQSRDYKIFLEIRSYFFDHINKLTQNNGIFSTLADRKFHEYVKIKLNTNLPFSQTPNSKLYSFNKLKNRSPDNIIKKCGPIIIKENFNQNFKTFSKYVSLTPVEPNFLLTKQSTSEILKPILKNTSHNNSKTKLNEIYQSKDTTKVSLKNSVSNLRNLNSLTIEYSSIDSFQNTKENIKSLKSFNIETKFPCSTKSNLKTENFFKTKIKNKSRFRGNIEKYIRDHKQSIQNRNQSFKIKENSLMRSLNFMRIDLNTLNSEKSEIKSVKNKSKVPFFTTAVD